MHYAIFDADNSWSSRAIVDNDCYVGAEQIALTDDDIVHLAATYDELTVHQHHWT